MAVVSILPGTIEMRYPTLSDNGENLVVALGIPVITRKPECPNMTEIAITTLQ